MTTTAVYCRISDDREGAGLGVERQEKDCRAAASALGWTVGRVYVDNDLSAYNRRKPRPQYLQLLADLRSRDVSALIVWHNDRLHRSSRELEDFIDVVESTGAAVQTVKAGKYDLTTPTGRMHARIVGAVAQYESEHKAERNRAKALELAVAGKVGNGGPRPFGYEPDRITVREAEADLIREAYADVLVGKGLRTICREWHERGILTSAGKPFSVQGLRFTLLRGRNIGWRSHHGKLIAPAVWKPVIDRDTYEQTVALLTDSTRLSNPAAYVRKYLLTGLVTCGRCGAAMKPIRTHGQVRLSCRKEPGSANCGGRVIRYDPVEDLIVRAMMDRLDRAQLEPEPASDPTEALRRQIADQEARLTALADAYADEDGDLLDFRRAGQRIRARIADLRRQIAEEGLTQRLADPIRVREEWHGHDVHQRRAILAQVIERVEVGPAVRGRTAFDRDRLTVVWR